MRLEVDIEIRIYLHNFQGIILWPLFYNREASVRTLYQGNLVIGR